MSYDFDEDQLTLYVKGSNVSEVGQFLSTTDDVYISFYPNNCNDFLYDNYDKSILIGAINCNNYYQGYISSINCNIKNNIITFDNNKIQSYVDIIPSANNISLGNNSNPWKNIYINSNIYFGIVKIYTDNSSNIYISGSLNCVNLYNSNSILTNLLIASNINIYSNINSLDITANNIFNINTINCSNIFGSNLTVKNNLITNCNINNTIYSVNIYSSNIINTHQINTNNLISSNIITNNIYSSNINIYDNATVNNLTVTGTTYMNNNININNNFIPLSNNLYDLGSLNKKWKNLYVSSNLFIGTTVLAFSNSNIILNGDIYANNIISSNNVASSNININNSIYCGGTLNANIINNSNTIYTSNLISSNQLNVINLINTNNVVSSNIQSDYITTSNMKIYNNVISQELLSSNITTDNIFSSNTTIYNKLNANNLIVSNLATFNGIILDNSLITTSNDYYNIGSSNYKFKNIYLSSNIFIGNSKIYSLNSNIYISADVHTNNLFTTYIVASNIYVSNLFTSDGSIYTSNITNSNIITTNYLLSSNINVNGILSTNNLKINNNLNSFSINASNLSVYNTLTTQLINSSNINSYNIVSSNISAFNIITSNINVSNILNLLGTTVISSDIIPSIDAKYNIGSSNINWKDVYLSGSLYLDDIIIASDKINGGIKITNAINKYESINANSIKLISNNTSDYVIIGIDQTGVLTFTDNNNKTSSIGISYKDLSDSPFIYLNSTTLFTSNNIIFNESLISSNNTILYGNIGINTNQPKSALDVNGNIISKTLQGSFIGNGNELSNIIASNIIGVVSVSQGGSGCNILPYGSVLIGNNNNPVITTPNLIWSNMNNTLIVNGNIISKNIYGNFIGDGTNLSNINVNNIINPISVINGGTGCNSLPYGNILIGNDNKPLIVSPNLTWTNTLNTLNVGGSINTNTIKCNNINSTQNFLVGDGSGLVNIIASNIIGIISVANGGTGCNSLPYGSVIIGNNNNPVITSPNITWSNNQNTLYVNGSVVSSKIQGSFIGHGSGLSNIIASNIIGIISVSQGGTGCNIIPYGSILIGNETNPVIISENLIWSNITKSLHVNGNINANNIQGKFIGDGSELSNIIANTIIGTLGVSQGGTGCNTIPYGSVLIGNNNDPLITTPKLIWSNMANTLLINGSVNAATIKGAFIGDGYNISNIVASNIIGILPVSNGGTGRDILPYGSIIIGNDKNSVITSDKFIWSNMTNTLNIKGDIYANDIQGAFIGNGAGLSNLIASNINGIISVENGGTGCNSIPYGQILIGNNNKPINTFNNILWDFNNSSLNITGNLNSDIITINNYLNASNIFGAFIGDGSGLSNIIASNMLGILNVVNGGTGCNILPYGSILIGNNSNPVITPTNLKWFDTTNTLNVNGIIKSSSIQGSFIGDGSELSNINASNIVGVLTVLQGGTGCNLLPYGSVIVGNNNNPVITTPNLTWSNITNILNINGTVTANKINGSFIGDGSGLSNIIANNIIGVLSVSQGGTGCNILPYGSVLIGNNNNPVITSTNVTWNDITKTLNIKGSLIGNNVQGKFIGDGTELSNIISSNIVGVLSVPQGGTGCNIIPYGNIIIGNNISPVITSSDIVWSNVTNTLNINGSIYANTIQGKFIGDGTGLSNMIASNIIGTLTVSQGGTGCNTIPYGNIVIGNNNNTVITTENFVWSNNTNSLIINGSINATNIKGSFIGDGTNISNIIASNIVGILSVNQGGTGCNRLLYNSILIGNNDKPVIITDNFTWSELTNSLNINGNIYSKNFQGAFIGNGAGLSNIIASNIIGALNVTQGGTGCNILPYANVLVGNNTNAVNTSPNFTWSNITNTLNINGTIYSKNIQGGFIGDGSGLSNIVASNIIGNVPVINGGSGCNNLPYGNILIGNNNKSILTDNNLVWSNTNNTLIVNGNINAKNITGGFIGDGTGISNIVASNINGIFSVSQGGSGCNILPGGNIIIGNESKPVITTSNLLWDNINNVLNIKGSLVSSNATINNIYSSSINAVNIQGTFIGDGNDLSNISASNITGVLSVLQGGTGRNNIPIGSVLIGNNANPVITSPNLSWNNSLNALDINGIINTSKIYSKFIGDGSELSNIISSNINGILNVSQGGTGCNLLPYGKVLIGNNLNPLITSDDLIWSNIQKNLIVNGNINASNFQGKFFGSFYGLNFSSYNASNIIGAISLEQGGTGCNSIPYGNIVIGNYSNAIITTSNLYWDNIKNSLYINGSVYASNINGNIFASNITGVVSVINGGTGCNNLPFGQLLIGNNNSSPIITTPNLLWNNTNNSLNINGNIISCNVYSSFTGDGYGLSNINIKNISGIIPVINGGTGCNSLAYGQLLIGNNDKPIISTSKLSWNDSLNILNIEGKLAATEIYGSFIGDGSRISNIVCSNLVGILPISNGGIGTTKIDIGQILIGNDTNPVKSSPNFKWNNLLNYLYVNGDIYANNIIADNISRLVASNIVGRIDVINGGTGCNLLPYGNVLIGNNQNSLITSPNFMWSNITNELFINGNINSTNIQGTFIGDGNNLSNFNINNILGVININNGGTGCNNIPYGQLLIGNNSNSIITTKDLIWSNVDKKLLVNGNIYAKKIQGSFAGDGTNISNLSAANIATGILNISQGGTGCNVIPYGHIIVGNESKPIITTPNFTWNDSQNKLNINGSIYTQNIQGKFYGDGNNVSNINASNIIGIISVINGGTGCNSLPMNTVLIGNNSNPIITSSNLLFNNNTLSINGNIITKSVYINNNIYSSIIQGKYYGDGANLSNLNASNIIGLLSVANGGTGSNFFNQNEIILGNNNNTLITYSNLRWDNITNKLSVIGNIYGNNIQGKFYGDGTNISNFVASNLLGVVSVKQGGTGCNSIPLGQILIGNNENTIITTSNFLWDNTSNILFVNGDIIANNISVKSIYINKLPAGKFIGDGTNISNFVASNIIGIIPVTSGGTGRSSLPFMQVLLGNDSNPITSTSLFTWDNNSNILSISNSIINTSSLLTTSLYVSNITVYNSINVNRSINNNIIANNIQGAFYGDGNNISNFTGSNIIGIVSVVNGGTGCNNIPFGQLLIGNRNNPILTTSNLLWDPVIKRLYVDGNINANNINLSQDIFARNIQGGLYGDGSSISNILVNNITGPGILSVTNGGTGQSSLTRNQILVGNGNNILLTPNFNWNNTTNTLSVNGTIFASNIFTTSTVNCLNININCNLNVNRSTHNLIYANTVQGSFIGNGEELSNISANNIIGILNVRNGGTGCNILPMGQLLIGNNQNAVLTSSRVSWNNINNTLNIVGNISASNINISNNLIANSIYGMFYGDGMNISNIVASNIIGPGILSVANGGTGYSSIPSSQILIGNDSNILLTTSNLSWDNAGSVLNINGNINTYNINNSNIIYSSNINIFNTLNVNNSFHNNIIANNIQGRFIGDGTNISNLNGNNIRGIVNVSNGGSGCNIFQDGHILIGNNTKPVITTNNLIWNNNTNNLSINGDINVANINVVNNISTKTIEGKFIGDGSGLSNIGANNIVGVVNVVNGGIGTSSIQSMRILYGNDTEPVGNSDNFLWDNSRNSLYVNGFIYTNSINSSSSIYTINIYTIATINANNGSFNNIYGSNIQGKFYGDGSSISNLVSSNIIGTLNVVNGGTGCNNIPYGQIVVGNNSNTVITSRNLTWDNLNNKLNINGDIYANNAYLSQNLYAKNIQGAFYGNGTNISNIIGSNIIGEGVVSVINGGTGNSTLPINQILIGNNINPIYSTSNFTWDNISNILNINGSVKTNYINANIIEGIDINISNLITANNANVTNINAKTIQGSFYGDGSELSNIKLNNIIGIFQVFNGGTGCNLLPSNQILIGNDTNPVLTTSNFMINNNNLLVNGNINANNIYASSNIFTNYIKGKFHGDGANISNINASNIIGSGIISVINGGTGLSTIPVTRILVGNNNSPLINSANFTWNNDTNTLNVNGNINTNILNITNTLISSNITILNTLTTNNAFFNSSLNANKIQGKFIGDGIGLSNVLTSNVIGILSVSNGGTGCNNFTKGQILIGNGTNPINTTSNFIWDDFNNNLTVNDKIFTNNLIANQNISGKFIQGGFYGDGANISNIVASNIIGSSFMSIANGGTGLTTIPSMRILIGNDDNPILTSPNLIWSGDTLYLNGSLYTNNINVSSTIYSTNAIVLNTLTVNKGIFPISLYSSFIQGKFYGDGTNISNIIGSNIIGTVNVNNGGTGCNILPQGQILIGNNNNPLITTNNLTWNNNTLNVTGNIITSNVNVINTLTLNYLETCNINMTGWNNTNDIFNGIKYKNKPFYISLYLSTNYNNIQTTFAVPFTVNYNNIGGMTFSSPNIEPAYWNNNFFTAPVNGLYCINYSACCLNTNFYMWINKTNDFVNNYSNRFGIQNSLSINGCSTSVTINSLANERWYFIIYNGGNLLVNNNFFNTKASISLLQEIL
jgi:hypothetical protein